MPKLREMLDQLGWERPQLGELPKDLPLQSDTYSDGVKKYDLYALNGVAVVVEDDRQIVELCGVRKVPTGYWRGASLPNSRVVRVDNFAEFLDGFKHLHSFRNRFLFAPEERMDFEGIGQRMKESGELYSHP